VDNDDELVEDFEELLDEYSSRSELRKLRIPSEIPSAPPPRIATFNQFVPGFTTSPSCIGMNDGNW
jgi:hypothetical protein